VAGHAVQTIRRRRYRRSSVTFRLFSRGPFYPPPNWTSATPANLVFNSPFLPPGSRLPRVKYNCYYFLDLGARYIFEPIAIG